MEPAAFVELLAPWPDMHESGRKELLWHFLHYPDGFAGHVAFWRERVARGERIGAGALVKGARNGKPAEHQGRIDSEKRARVALEIANADRLREHAGTWARESFTAGVAERDARDELEERGVLPHDVVRALMEAGSAPQARADSLEESAATDEERAAVLALLEGVSSRIGSGGERPAVATNEQAPSSTGSEPSGGEAHQVREPGRERPTVEAVRLARALEWADKLAADGTPFGTAESLFANFARDLEPDARDRVRAAAMRRYDELRAAAAADPNGVTT